MRTDIIIPTCKASDDPALLAQRTQIQASATGDVRIHATCAKASAAINRNLGLDWARAPWLVMVDDDVTDFPDGWNEALCGVLADRPECVMVSARLLRPDGQLGQMLGNPPDRPGDIIEVPRRELPTACIAIRHDGTRFGEQYVGSGWEDTDFAARLRVIYPEGTFLVHCGVRVVHHNEQKEQAGNFYPNKGRYEAVWGKHPYF